MDHDAQLPDHDGAQCSKLRSYCITPTNSNQSGRLARRNGLAMGRIAENSETQSIEWAARAIFERKTTEQRTIRTNCDYVYPTSPLPPPSAWKHPFGVLTPRVDKSFQNKPGSIPPGFSTFPCLVHFRTKLATTSPLEASATNYTNDGTRRRVVYQIWAISHGQLEYIRRHRGQQVVCHPSSMLCLMRAWKFCRPSTGTPSRETKNSATTSSLPYLRRFRENTKAWTTHIGDLARKAA